jgi:hypothetical protein
MRRPNAFEPSILMKREEIPLPQFIISYETVIKRQEFFYRLERTGAALPCDWVTVYVCILYHQIFSYSNKLFMNL